MAVAAPVTIDFWHSMTGDKSLLLEQLVADFNKNPANKERIKISMTYVGNYVEGINKLRTSLIANKGPHIAQIFEIGTQVMIDSKAATPLEDLIGQDKEFGLDQMLPQVVQYYKVSGRLYSLPFATSNPIIYYNADWFKKAGKIPMIIEGGGFAGIGKYGSRWMGDNLGHLSDMSNSLIGV